jgi:Protein of unknown function (DUF1553)/Protein of unknown function (DUF1549)/Concanavalin A-like lectin/glucanases superfamily/Planctomycete cytochrome C
MRWPLALIFAFTSLPLAAAPPDFDRQVAPLLARRCLDCHSGADAKAKLDLSRKASAAEQVVPGKSTESELWKRVSADEMPPKKPLTAEEKAILKSWIDGGAAWGTDPIDPFATSNEHRAGRDWWALREIRNAEFGMRNSSIDGFVRAKLESKGLKPSPQADPRTLVRRLSFDLLGLPPTAEEIDAFAKDPSDAAYAKLVEKMLASPHFGERWARHWLDLVRYGESDSFERNEPRPNAWHYRDWVIRSLNADMPFDRFAKLQLAGDVLEPDNPDAVKATGFLVAGIHNTVLGSNKIANEIARQDELEDLLAAVGQTFLGLTVQCARCHDHKFDPVTQTDYYRLAAALGGVHHSERTVDTMENQKRRRDLAARMELIGKRQSELESQGRTRAVAKRGNGKTATPVTPIARWSFDTDLRDSIGELHVELKAGAKLANGRLVVDGKQAHAITAPLKRDLSEKTLEAWVVLPTLAQGGGGVITVESLDGTVFDSIVFAERQPKKWVPGSNGFVRTRDLNGEPESKANEPIHVALSYARDGRIALYRNGTLYGESYKATHLIGFKAGEAHVAFGLRHKNGGKPFLAGEINEARLYDKALSQSEIAESFKAGPTALGVSLDELLAELTAAERTERSNIVAEQKRIRAEQAKIAPPTPIYAVNSKAVPKTHILSRGSVEKPKTEVTPGGVAAVPGAADFGLPGDAPEGVRRAKLAEWIARKENPLFARVIVNRLWYHHFGVGLVETPSDFGFNGGRPSHPELLDWLANELIRSNWSLKHVHRLILRSATYRQSSRNPKSEIRNPKSIDADNRLLWRKSPSRLDAESIRDAILTASGQLNPAMGGPPFHDVRIYGDKGTKYYEPIDPVGAEFNRRTIYRFSPRGERSALLETFDCPEPSALTPRRQVTTTPLQALALWNNAFVLRMSGHFADRIETECAKAGDASAATKVMLAYRFALARSPSEAETKLGVEFVAVHGLKAFGRVLFNCNEFVVIE